ncbi:MAG: hypothetical protein ACQEWW_01400 [Bacillota bacterium]
MSNQAIASKSLIAGVSLTASIVKGKYSNIAGRVSTYHVSHLIRIAEILKKFKVKIYRIPITTATAK